MSTSAPHPRRRLSVAPLGLMAFILLTAHALASPSRPAGSVNPGEYESAPLGAGALEEQAFREGSAAYEAGDYAGAVRHWRSPAEHGHALAQFNLGIAFATGLGANIDIAEALRWWSAAAHQGHAAAQYNLGLLYSRGQGVEKNMETAATWWQKAASRGDAAAQFQLGALAAMGEGRPRDFGDAARWWRRSAAQGFEQAIKGLEILRAHGALKDE